LVNPAKYLLNAPPDSVDRHNRTVSAAHTIDELLDRAVRAINSGDRATADALAGRVLAVDRANADAEELLAAPVDSGEIRRMTMLFTDLVDSTALSTNVEPEIYRTIVGRYRDEVLRIVDRYEGHVASIKGDGLLSVFGHPQPHEDDVRRAVQAGLDITNEVTSLSERVRRRFGFEINVRVGIHRGLVYLDTKQDDVYGFAANLASRICGLAEPGTVVVSEAVERLIRATFDLELRVPKPVKGVDEPVGHYRVVADRDTAKIPLGPLVGRKDAIEYLAESWAGAKSGTLTTPGVVFHGEAGIGKSRLASAAVDLAERSHAAVFRLIGSPFHTDVGLHPVRRLLERRCGITRASDSFERLRHLEAEVRERSLDPVTVVPLLAPVLGIPPESGYQAVQAEGRKLYDQIVRAVHGYLLTAMRDGPTLLLIEDTHWFDEDTIEVVRSLLDEKLGSVMMVVTGREKALLPDDSRAKVFDLGPLTDQEADDLILALDPGMDDQIRSAVRRRCDGVPLYIEEVVAKLREQPTDESGSSGVPDSLYEALFARLRSSDEAVVVVQAAAIMGSRVDRGILLSVLESNDRDVDVVIEELVRGRVLQPLENQNWRFRHELLREVAAELSPPSVRRRLHSRVADALAAAGADGNPDWPVVAGHYQLAERYVEAAAAYGQASSIARRRGALNESRAYLSRAIVQIEQASGGPERDRGEILLRLRHGFLTYAAEGVSSPNAAADFERCLQLSGGELEDDEFFSTLVAMYAYFAIRADLRRVEDLLESVRITLTGRREWFRPFNSAGFGMVAWYRGEFDNALAKLEAAALARSEEGAQELEAVWFMPNEGTASIYTHLALARFVVGDLAGAETELERTERRCEALPFPQGAFSLAYARQMEVLIRIEAEQFERAMQVAKTLATGGEQHGFDSWTMVGAAQQAVVAAMSSLRTNTVDSETLGTQIATITGVVDAWRALGVKSLITIYDGVLVRLLIAAGQLPEARDRLKLALELAEETGMRFYNAELLRIRAHTTDDDSARRADLRGAVELARQQGGLIFELRAASDLFELYGDRQTLVDAINRFPSDSTWPEVSRARALVTLP
jgi:class 3 adenylate cyclase